MRYAYNLRGTVVGFNLPFDLSRIAIDSSTALTKLVRGGFTFKLSPSEYRPHVQVKSINSRAALIQFATPKSGNPTGRAMRNRGLVVRSHRGYFVDVRTLAGAMLEGSWKLEDLAEHLGVEHPKMKAPRHGEALTAEYIDYAVRDPLTTW